MTMPKEGAMTVARPASKLANIKATRLKEPPRILIYGVEGVGKSSMAAHAPAPIWFDVEGGSIHLEVSRYPFRDEEGGHVPRDFSEVLRALDDLLANDHPFRTLVIDTVDRLESLIWRHMLDRDSQAGKPMTSVESYGYGKGYVMAVDEWRGLCVRLDRLRATKRMGIVLIGHSQIRTFKSPDSSDYDRYNLRLNDKAAGFLKEWADVTGFACFEDGAGKTPGAADDRVRGFATGRRLLKLERTAAFDAKSRLPLPPEVEMDPADPWGPLARAVEAGGEMSLDQLRKSIDAEVARIGDADLAAKVAAAVEVAVKASDTDALSRYLMSLKKKQPQVAA